MWPCKLVSDTYCELNPDPPTFAGASALGGVPRARADQQGVHALRQRDPARLAGRDCAPLLFEEGHIGGPEEAAEGEGEGHDGRQWDRGVMGKEGRCGRLAEAAVPAWRARFWK